MSTTIASPAIRMPRPTPLCIHTAAWSVPVMVLGGFSTLAIIPVIMILVGS